MGAQGSAAKRGRTDQPSGGTIQIALAWMADGYAEPLEAVVEAAVWLFAGVRG